MTLTSIADYATRIQPGRGAWPEPADAPVTDPAPTLGGLIITHPDLRAIVERIVDWKRAVRDAVAAQNDLGATADDCRLPSLIISGPNGTGKSHIAQAIRYSVLTTIVRDGDGHDEPGTCAPRSKWFAAADLLARLGNERDGDGYSYSARPSQIVGSAPYIVIDDVAAELSIPFVAYPAQEIERQIRYYLLLDWCAKNNVAVILTTNLASAGPDSDLAAHVGPRAWSRLMQMVPAGFILSLWNVPDYRLIAGGRGERQ